MGGCEHSFRELQGEKDALGKLRNVRFPSLLVLSLTLANRTDSAQESWGLLQPEKQLQHPLGSRTFRAILIKLLSIRDKLESTEVNGHISIDFKGL